jgi:DNA-directed RNA polymerase subunit RPC12/RpoP/DNA-directed RNA polymerase subunit M/transcription elongation factor TFIIS
LIPFAVEIITIITIILIGVILTVYLSVLKKNGWIGEVSNYRCPNPQCRKIFQAPMKVKDFSTGKEAGFACPECGYDLGPLKGGKGLKETALQSEPELKIKDSLSKPIEAGDSKANGCVKEPKAPVTAHPTLESEKNPIKQSTVQTAGQPYIVENTTINQVGVKEKEGRFTCPACKKEFSTPLFALEYAASTPRLIRRCPYCDKPLE